MRRSAGSARCRQLRSCRRKTLRRSLAWKAVAVAKAKAKAAAKAAAGVGDAASAAAAAAPAAALAEDAAEDEVALVEQAEREGGEER